MAAKEDGAGAGAGAGAALKDACTAQEGGDNTATAPPPRLHIHFPPVKSQEDIVKEQKASFSQEDMRASMQETIPPVIRSVLELAHFNVGAHSHYLRAAPGYQGGMFLNGKPYCFSGGYRDGLRPQDSEDQSNFIRLKDPLVYGALSLPVTVGYLCELHGKSTFHLDRPLLEYLPELHTKLDPSVTARSILNFTTTIDDRVVLKDAGARWRRPHLAWNACAAEQTYVYHPISRFLAAGSEAALNGRQQRANLVQYVRSAPRIKGFTHRPLLRGRFSHFSVALLIAAVETQLNGASFEDSIRKLFFEPAQCHGAGYGPPKPWRDPNALFYQPTGVSRLHQGFYKPVEIGSLDNCGPPVLNASLNLYAPVEEFAKLLLLSLDTIQDARELLGHPEENTSHYDLGVRILSGRRYMQLRSCIVGGIDFIPSAAAFRYSVKDDLGCFGVSNCGSRDGRLLANTISHVVQYLFIRHVLRQNVDAEKPIDFDNLDERQSTSDDKLKEKVNAQQPKRYFTRMDAHTRF